MASPQLAELPSLPRAVDSVREAVDRLEAMLPKREESDVLLDFIEDDLREGFEAIADVEAHFTDILDTLRNEPIKPIRLLECSDDFRTLERLEYLMVVIAQLRRRMAQAAGALQNARITT